MPNNSESFLEEELSFIKQPETNLNYPPILRELKQFYDWIRVVLTLIPEVRKGWLEYKKTGITPSKSYSLFIELFCKTAGISNEVIHFFVKRSRPGYTFHSTKGFLGDLNRKTIREISKAIRKDGYFIFPNRLPLDVVEALEKRALETPVSPDLANPVPDVKYDASNIQAARYLHQNQAVMGMPEVHELIGDPSLLAVAQDYLGCAPAIDLVTMARSTTFLKYPSALSAQYYHFDMDRIRWLKFFIYLTDVTSETGPTCFVKGSHRPFGIPFELLRYQYARLPDAFVEEFYPKDRFVEITGPKGTIFAFDSRGLHKGKNLISGERQILQFEFVNCLFGMRTNPVVCTTRSQTLIEATKKYPSFYEIMKINAEE